MGDSAPRQYRLETVTGGAMSAGRAEWFEDGRLRIEFNRLSLINRIVIDARFREDEVELVISEPTELGTVKVRGQRVP